MIETEVMGLFLSIQLFRAGTILGRLQTRLATRSEEQPSRLRPWLRELALRRYCAKVTAVRRPGPADCLLEQSRLMNKALLYLTLLCAVPWLGFAQTQSTPTPDESTGIQGTISVAPVQAGPTRQGGADSLPLARMAFEVKQGGRVVQSFQTDERGNFSVRLQPGHYTVMRKDWRRAIGFYGPFEVEVAPGKMKKVDWKCDSGLR
jgi:hypothetical protein